MVVYLLLDDDPQGGYYAAQEFKPDMRVERRSISEVRVVENFPQDMWQLVLQGGLPVDEDGSNDSTWVGWWTDPSARTVWAR